MTGSSLREVEPGSRIVNFRHKMGLAPAEFEIRNADGGEPLGEEARRFVVCSAADGKGVLSVGLETNPSGGTTIAIQDLPERSTSLNPGFVEDAVKNVMTTAFTYRAVLDPFASDIDPEMLERIARPTRAALGEYAIAA